MFDLKVADKQTEFHAEWQ